MGKIRYLGKGLTESITKINEILEDRLLTEEEKIELKQIRDINIDLLHSLVKNVKQGKG